MDTTMNMRSFPYSLRYCLIYLGKYSNSHKYCNSFVPSVSCLIVTFIVLMFARKSVLLEVLMQRIMLNLVILFPF